MPTHSPLPQYHLPPSLTLIRPTMSPVATLQRKYLRGSMRPYIFLSLFLLVLMVYFALRLWDIAHLASGAHTSALLSNSNDSDENALEDSIEPSVRGARERMMDGSSVSAPPRNEADDSKPRSEVLLVWRLFIVAVEALHGLATLISAAVACGASSYVSAHISRYFFSLQ